KAHFFEHPYHAKSACWRHAIDGNHFSPPLVAHARLHLTAIRNDVISPSAHRLSNIPRVSMRRVSLNTTAAGGLYPSCRLPITRGSGRNKSIYIGDEVSPPIQIWLPNCKWITHCSSDENRSGRTSCDVVETCRRRKPLSKFRPRALSPSAAAQFILRVYNNT